jgi:hypothetical protein
MAKIFIIILIILLLGNPLNAQIDNQVPLTPSSSTLKGYLDFQHSGSTGTPTIDIPLYEVKIKGYTLPISLGYAATGVKVADIASRYGMGWSLNAGPFIHQKIFMRDDRDDEVFFNYNYCNPELYNLTPTCTDTQYVFQDTILGIL